MHHGTEAASGSLLTRRDLDTGFGFFGFETGFSITQTDLEPRMCYVAKGDLALLTLLFTACTWWSRYILSHAYTQGHMNAELHA